MNLTILRFIYAGAGFLTSILLFREYGPDVLGSFVIVITLSQLFGLLILFGFDIWSLKNFYDAQEKKDINKEIFNAGFKKYIVFSVSFLLVGITLFVLEISNVEVLIGTILAPVMGFIRLFSEIHRIVGSISFSIFIRFGHGLVALISILIFITLPFKFNYFNLGVSVAALSIIFIFILTLISSFKLVSYKNILDAKLSISPKASSMKNFFIGPPLLSLRPQIELLMAYLIFEKDTFGIISLLHKFLEIIPLSVSGIIAKAPHYLLHSSKKKIDTLKDIIKLSFFSSFAGLLIFIALLHILDNYGILKIDIENFMLYIFILGIGRFITAASGPLEAFIYLEGFQANTSSLITYVFLTLPFLIYFFSTQFALIGFAISTLFAPLILRSYSWFIIFRTRIHTK